MRSTRIGSFSASRAERLLSIAQQRQASAMETAPAADPDHPPRGAEQGSAQDHDRRGGRFARLRCSGKTRTASAMVKGASRFQEERSARPLRRASPKSMNTGAAPRPRDHRRASQGASDRASGASARLGRANRNARPRPGEQGARTSGCVPEQQLETGAPSPKSSAEASPRASLAAVWRSTAASLRRQRLLQVRDHVLGVFQPEEADEIRRGSRSPAAPRG